MVTEIARKEFFVEIKVEVMEILLQKRKVGGVVDLHSQMEVQ